jgi:Na+/serine symporter
MQDVKEITENFIESQKAIINSFQSAWRPYQQSLNNKVNTCISPEAAANAYSRIVSTIADNSITALRTTNNLVFSSLDAYKTTMQHAKENTKQIFDINTKTAKTLEQNTKAVQDSASRFNTSFTNNQGNTANTSGTTSTTTTSTTSAA